MTTNVVIESIIESSRSTSSRDQGVHDEHHELHDVSRRTGRAAGGAARSASTAGGIDRDVLQRLVVLCLVRHAVIRLQSAQLMSAHLIGTRLLRP